MEVEEGLHTAELVGGEKTNDRARERRKEKGTTTIEYIMVHL